MNTNKLRGKIVEKRETLEKLANTLGIDRSTVYRKMQDNGNNFTIGEANKIVKFLSLTSDEATEIFFSD